MSVVKLAAFDGLIPKLSPTLLGESFAQVATNVKLYSGELRHWRGPQLAYSPPDGNYTTLYRLFHHTGATAFLLWKPDPTATPPKDGLVDVAVSPTADAAQESRIYYTGDGPPKKTNWQLATGGAEPYPSAYMPMGVTPPADPATVAITVAGTGTFERRAYVYTNVQLFGTLEAESAPSPVPTPTVAGLAEIDVPILGSTVRVSGFTAPVAAENIVKRRIYRTVVGATTVSYQLVAEIPVSATFYDDSKAAADIGPDLLTTLGWLPPPQDLAGLVVLPGGSLVGFSKNTVYFSEPHMPHAWPLAYAITLPVMKIVGLGIVGSSVVVMTGTNPYFIHGGFPGEMYTEKIPLVEPCVSKTTIATDEDGVVYASPNGLVSISPNTRGIVTGNLYTTDEWSKLNPLTMKGTILQGRYFGVFPNTVPSRAIVLSRTEPPALSHVQLPAIALHTDARNGFLFYVNDTDHRVYQLDANEATPMSYEWRSKRFWSGRALTFSLLRLDADYSQLGDERAFEEERADAIAWNTSHYGQDLMGAINAVPIHGPEGDLTGEGKQAFDINGSILRNLPSVASARTVQVVLYGDDADVDGQLDVMANLNLFSVDPIRIPPFKSRELEVVILGNVDVRSLTMATTMEELLAAQ